MTPSKTPTCVVALLAVLALLAPPTAAQGNPLEDTRIGGQVMQDNTLVALVYTGLSGGTQWLSETETFRADEIGVIAYAPRLEGQDVTLRMTWEAEEIVTERVVVNGSVQTRTTTAWEEIRTETYTVPTDPNRKTGTNVDVPTLHGTRLTITYEATNETLWEGGYDTSKAYSMTPAESLQDEWAKKVEFGGALAAAALVGLVLSRWLYTRAGGWAPPMGRREWGTLFIGILASSTLLWNQHREMLLLQGPRIPAAITFVVTAFVSLAIWSRRAERWRLHNHTANEDARQQETREWTLIIPADREEDRNASKDPYLYPVLLSTWGDWVRAVLGLRRYVRFPEDRDWYREVPNRAGISRYILLEDDLLYPPKPSLLGLLPDSLLFWRDYGEEPRIGVELPVAPRQEEERLEVIAGEKTSEEIAQTLHKREEEVAELRAKQEVGMVDKARDLLDMILDAESLARREDETDDDEGRGAAPTPTTDSDDTDPGPEGAAA